MDLVLLTIVSAIAFRGACCLAQYANVLDHPLWTTRPEGRGFLSVYVFGAIPIGCLNGYLLYGGVGLVLCGLGTWLGMLLANLILRFNPGRQFHWFGSVNIIWTIVNLIRSVS